MARARSIKPSFFHNETLAELPTEARLLFIGLWTIADREGRLEDRPKRIKAQIFPYEEYDVDVLLTALASGGFIVRYTIDERRFICCPTWRKHQNPHQRETKSEIPQPNQEDVQGTEKAVQGPPFPVRAVLEPLTLNPEPGTLNPEPGPARVGQTPPYDGSDTRRGDRVSRVTVSLPKWRVDGEFLEFVALYQRSGKPVIDEDFTEAYPVWTALDFEQRLDRIAKLRANIETGGYGDPRFMPSPKRFLVSEHKRVLKPPRPAESSKAELTRQLLDQRLSKVLEMKQ